MFFFNHCWGFKVLNSKKKTNYLCFYCVGLLFYVKIAKMIAYAEQRSVLMKKLVGLQSR